MARNTEKAQVRARARSPLWAYLCGVALALGRPLASEPCVVRLTRRAPHRPTPLASAQQHVLNRLVAGKREEKEGPRATRPYLASECASLGEAEKWRMEIVREVGKKVSVIQNGAARCAACQGSSATTCQPSERCSCSVTHSQLPASDPPGTRAACRGPRGAQDPRPQRPDQQAAAREVPLGEAHQGARRARPPGARASPPAATRQRCSADSHAEPTSPGARAGPSPPSPPTPQTSAPRLDDDTSLEIVPGKGGGYRYFGAAKNLPGVKELFIKEPTLRPKRTRAQISKGLDADYYGYRDDDDGVLVELEAQAEQRLRRAALERWKGEHADAGGGADVEMDAGAEGAGFLAHVPLPSDADIEKAVLQRRKQELMAKYLSADGE